MPRTNTKPVNARKYASYDEEVMEKALKEIKKGDLTMRKASGKYGIPLGTFYHRMNKKHNKKVGRPTVLTGLEEEAIVSHLLTCVEGAGFLLIALS